MVDERTLELIHAEIDGELDAIGRAELERRLQGVPEARALRDELVRISGSLSRLPEVAPPEDLRPRLLPPVATRPTAMIVPFPRRATQVVRYSLAFAAGVMVAAIGWSAIQNDRPAFDPNQLVGTMGRQAQHPAGAAIATIQAALPEIRGTVTLRPADGAWLLLFDLDSAQPVTVSAAYGARSFRLAGYAQGDAGVTSFTAAPGRIGFVNQGAQRLALFLQPQAGGPVRVRFESSGRVLQDAALQVPATAPGR